MQNQKKKVEVVAVVIMHNQKILCVQRSENKYAYISKKFEFLGGKMEEGETKKQTIIREIKEELNLDIFELDFFQTVDHQYPDFKITMHAFKCFASNLKEIKLNEHLNFLQLSLSQLSGLDWAAADIPFVDKLISESNG